jgi:hypothetical protein
MRCSLATLLAVVMSLRLGAQPVLPLPSRSPSARTGSQVFALVSGMSREAREDAIYAEITAGNIPDFLRPLRAVTVTSTVGNTPRTATYYVTCDYLAVGSNADSFRMPMTPILAQWLADHTQCSLPTRKMVDDIYAATTSKLAPQPIPPSSAMVTVPVFWQHHSMIETARVEAGFPVGAFLGGIKKDVVITPQLPTRPPPPRVAIYGWHQLNGTPIQPLSLVHENTYADYSHGIRLVRNEMLLDGVTTTVQAILAHPTLHVLLSDEGVINAPRYPVPAPPRTFPYQDNFPSTGTELSWTGRFTTPAVVAFSPAAPGGDGYVLRVRDTSGGIETARTGRLTDTNYIVECSIYCHYRPALAADGFERVGIFVRDNGNGMFEGISGGGVQGYNYALTWDSHNGRVQCLRTVAGVAVDLLPAAEFRPSSGWRRMRIEAVGSQITFQLDGATLVSASDSTHAAGQFGIGYHEYFATNANILGTHAESFSAVTPAGAGIGDWKTY